jgi:hypothetical protein
MRNILSASTPLAFLDSVASRLLEQARENFRRLQLSTQQVIASGNQVRVLTWRGDRVNDTLAVWLTKLGLNAANEGLSVGVFNTERERVIDMLMNIAEMKAPSPAEMAESAENRLVEKWDGLLPEPLLNKGYGLRHFDIGATRELCAEIIAEEP